jgi:hypothetical protein
MRVLDHLLKAVRDAAVFNPEVQSAPACILWPDRDRQWEAIIPYLQNELPELFVLGEYAPDNQKGPAIWLRCVIAGKVERFDIARENPPILYLPGVGRQDLRAVESCPDYLKPLAELQYRGVIWSQVNAKDWTVMAFLKSDQGGLGLDVARDNDTKNAMLLGLYPLMDEPVDFLKGKHLDKDYFNTLLTSGALPPVDLFSNAESHGAWPQWNESAETRLRNDLKRLETFPDHKARKQLLDLEKKHADRRKLVWAELGQAPLARALAHLAVLARITGDSLTAGTMDDISAGYVNSGWRADEAVMQALLLVSDNDDADAVFAAIRAVYLPWAEEAARYLQKIADQYGYPGGPLEKSKLSSYSAGECILFVDGLRFDVAKRLSEKLDHAGCQVSEKPVWAALPSITATGKPAVSPVKMQIRGLETSVDFEPNDKDAGQSLKGGYHFKKLLKDSGWEVIDSKSVGDKQARGWTEFGNIDHEGHEKGWKLSKYIDGYLNEIQDRILRLLDAGWKRVRVVTDHGWLLVPGGLPKDELPSALTDNKWGRCAIIKSGAVIQENLYPWYWNPNQQIAIAHGVSCFRNGLEYSHGGLSFQECLTLELIALPGK